MGLFSVRCLESEFLNTHSRFVRMRQYLTMLPEFTFARVSAILLQEELLCLARLRTWLIALPVGVKTRALYSLVLPIRSK